MAPDGAFVPPHRAGAQKLLGVLITLGQAIAYVVTGMYGDVHDLGYFNAGAIVLQVRLLPCTLALAAAVSRRAPLAPERPPPRPSNPCVHVAHIRCPPLPTLPASCLRRASW